MKSEFVKILGGPSSTATTQTHEFELQDGGTLSLLISIHSTEPALSRIEAIRGVVNFLHHAITTKEFYFQDFKRQVGESVQHPPFDAAIVYNKEDIVYVFVVGSAHISIMRGGSLAPLVKGGSEVVGASGYLKSGDILVLSTQTFTDCVPNEELTGYLKKRTFEALEEDTATRIQEHEDRGSVGVAFVVTEPDILAEEPLMSVAPPHDPVHDNEPSVQSDPDSHHEESTQGEEDETAEEEADEMDESAQPVLDTDLVHGDPAPVDHVIDHPKAPPAIRDRFFVRDEGVYEARGKSRKLAVVGVVLIGLLGASIFFGAKARRAQDEEKKVKATISQAQEALAQAKTISNVNKAQARDLILEAREQVLGIQTSATYPELTSMKDALTQSLGDVAGVYEDTPAVFLDLSLIAADTKADEMSFSDNGIRILSKNERRVVTVALPGKRTESLPGTSLLSSPELIAAYDTRTFIADNGGLYEMGAQTKKQFDLPGGTSDLVMSAFAGNIYMVHKSQNAIWRYAGDGTIFAEKAAWLSEGVSVDLSKTTSMGIDGSIWVLSETGKITKFTLGNPQNVNLHGLTSQLSSSAILYTDDLTNFLYIVDPSTKSVFVFEKNGELVATYAHPEIGNATSIIVSEDNKLMLLAAGSRVLSLPTKHVK